MYKSNIQFRQDKNTKKYVKYKNKALIVKDKKVVKNKDPFYSPTIERNQEPFEFYGTQKNVTVKENKQFIKQLTHNLKDLVTPVSLYINLSVPIEIHQDMYCSGLMYPVNLYDEKWVLQMENEYETFDILKSYIVQRKYGKFVDYCNSKVLDNPYEITLMICEHCKNKDIIIWFIKTYKTEYVLQRKYTFNEFCYKNNFIGAYVSASFTKKFWFIHKNKLIVKHGFSTIPILLRKIIIQ
jgi:hypothetical protein